MTYTLLISRRAQKELANIARSELAWIRDAIISLSENPGPGNCKKLVGREGWRIRSGSYRVNYEIDDAKQDITVLHIGHRRDIYS